MGWPGWVVPGWRELAAPALGWPGGRSRGRAVLGWLGSAWADWAGLAWPGLGLVWAGMRSAGLARAAGVGVVGATVR